MMNVISPLIQFQQQIRIFHWQTSSFSQHKAFGKIYESLDEHIDSFVETYMGIFGRSKPTTTFVINLKSLTNDEVVFTVIDDFIMYLDDMGKEIPRETDLLNIRDSLRGEANKLKYLLSLS